MILGISARMTYMITTVIISSIHILSARKAIAIMDGMPTLCL
jgi:hypothetical protein